MTGYETLHARWYDFLYADKPYEQEAAFVDRLAGEPGGCLLDVGCGTGRHASAFAARGYRVTGIDINRNLLEHARAAAPSARFVDADMREFELFERFDLVTCLFDTIGYALTNEGVESSLRRFVRHLAPGGRIALEFLHGPALQRGADPVRIRRLALPGDRNLLRIAETTLDATAQTMHVAYELIEFSATGTFSRSTETQRNRFFGVAEMRALMNGAGVMAESMVAAYAEDHNIGLDTFHVLAVGKAAA